MGVSGCTLQAATLLALGLMLSGCGTDSGATPEAPAAPFRPAAASGEGVVRYDAYSAVVAQPGDSVSSMARRAGVDPRKLAAYNGIGLEADIRAGDELVLPPGS